VKRSQELRPLSVEHHQGLVAARHLRLAGRGERPLEETAASFLSTWLDEIEPHFRVEEAVLAPRYSDAVGADDPLLRQMRDEHAALRSAVGAFQAEPSVALAAEIGRSLDDHIRFEERILFPAVEAALAPAELIELGRELAAAVRPPACRVA
jgi:hypothetical protein